MSQTPDKLNEELRERLNSILVDHNNQLMNEYRGFPIETLNYFTANRITTAYAEAIRSAVPEKRGKIYRGGVKGDEKVYVATTDWQDAFNEAIDTFTTNLKERGLL